MGGSDGCRNDILLIVTDYKILAVSVSGTLGPQEISVRGTLGLQTGSRCMETTIRSSISSPSTSGNDPRLAYIWMYVCWDVHPDTYRDIWVRRVIIIIYIPVMPVKIPVMDLVMTLGILVMTPVTIPLCLLWCLLGLLLLQLGIPVILVMYSCYDYRMNCNSDFIRLDIRWHERKVYRWGFPCLDYPFDVLVSCDRDLSVYNQSCM